MNNSWNGFKTDVWQKECNVSDFIKKNYTLYEGDDSFLAGPTDKTNKVWNKCTELLAEETKKGGVLDDGIIYRFGPESFMAVVNAACAGTPGAC